MAAAFVRWRRTGAADRPVLSLIAVAACVGLGSFTFHTFATRLAGLADTIPIVAFIYGYLLLALRRYLGLRAWTALVVLVGFVVASHGLPRLMPGLLRGGLAHYLPALLAMIAIGVLARAQTPGRRMLITACVFAVSLGFRTADIPMCDAFPLGTHFIWHVLNGVVLYLLLRAAIDERGAKPLRV